MFNRLDQWVYQKAAKRNISLEPSVSRWGITQIAVCVFLFLFGLSVSFSALFISLRGISMHTAAIIALAFAILTSGGGIFVLIYWLHLSMRWLAEGSKDIPATKTDTAQITRILILIARKLGVSESEIEAEMQSKPTAVKKSRHQQKRRGTR